MSYLERNRRLLKEIDSNLPLQKGKQLGDGGISKFFSAGSYNSDELGTEVYVGLKEDNYKDPEQLRDRFIFELAVLSVVAKNLPHLLPELPLFYGLLIGKDGEPIAIVTEDFSLNGANYVGPSRFVPRGFSELFVEGTLDDDRAESISFNIRPKKIDGEVHAERVWRYGDFYPLIFWDKRDVHKTRFPENEIEERLDEYILKIDYDL